jgi:sucrose-phosphate synthase
MYIQMVNIHGLLRSEHIEMGRDADTGGQTRYVIDLVKQLTEFDPKIQIDLFTRQIRDKRVSDDYSVHIEQISPKCRIIRLPCGGGKYIRKEKLWPHLDEYVDRMIAFIRQESLIPDVIHGHYADSGYIASEIASIFGIPLVFTGHSLGRHKLKFLLDDGWTHENANREFSIDKRINVEEKILSQADLVIASTQYEKNVLYASYINAMVPSYKVIPPGLDLQLFFPYYDYQLPGTVIDERFKQARVRMLNELQRFHFNTEKPLILTLCRPDARKNIDMLVEIYGKDKELQALANIAVFAGIRDNILTMEEGEKKVLTDVLLLMDRYDLYGKMAVPKHHNPENDVPELYRIAATTNGVFVSTSFLETFGLTFIEASAVGLPFITTSRGGPEDIVENCRSGLLVDVDKPDLMVNTIKSILTNKLQWEELSNNGINRVRDLYSWFHHCGHYLKSLRTLTMKQKKEVKLVDKTISTIGRRLGMIRYLLISDVDDTLFGNNEDLLHLKKILKEHKNDIGFGVATGRYVESVCEILKEYGIEDVDIIISSVGTEMYYKMGTVNDKGWTSHIKQKWKPERIRHVIKKLPFMTLQAEPETQREFKISYLIDEEVDTKEVIPLVHDTLTKAHCAYTIIFSHGVYIDILPYRASKGKAVRYLSNKWKIRLENIITAGNSGNDRDMLTGNTSGIVVGNYEEELEILRNSLRVYFAHESHAGGIIEGLKYYHVIDDEE